MGAGVTFLGILMALVQSVRGEATTSSTASHACMAIAAMLKMPYVSRKPVVLKALAITAIGWSVVTISGQVQQKRYRSNRKLEEPYISPPP